MKMNIVQKYTKIEKKIKTHIYCMRVFIFLFLCTFLYDIHFLKLINSAFSHNL